MWRAYVMSRARDGLRSWSCVMWKWLQTVMRMVSTLGGRGGEWNGERAALAASRVSWELCKSAKAMIRFKAPSNSRMLS